jgi:UDP-N-acetylglucosamine acyltransferase
MIHKSSVVHNNAKIWSDVEIGPFCSIGENVKIAEKCKLHSHINIQGDVTIGSNTEIFPFASIGSVPQDLKYKGEDTKVIIGSSCKIREYVTINKGTKGGGSITMIGNNCLMMIGTHIAHDCLIGNNVIFANHSTLAGHVILKDNVVVGALSAIHQFSKIGEGAMIGGMSGVTADVVPYSTVVGNRAKLSGLNILGLKRRNIEKNEISELRKVYKYIFHNNKDTLRERVINMKQKEFKEQTIKTFLEFLSEDSDRSFTLP